MFLIVNGLRFECLVEVFGWVCGILISFGYLIAFNNVFKVGIILKLDYGFLYLFYVSL